MSSESRTDPQPRRWLRRLGLIVLSLLMLLAAAVAWKPSRVTLQTLLLVPSLVDAGPQPLQLLTPTPRRETLRYRSDPGASADLADLWLPAGASRDRPVGGMVLVLGINNVGRGYPADLVERYGGLAPPVLDGYDGKLDFLGVNYYTRRFVRASSEEPLGFAVLPARGRTTEMGWAVMEKRGVPSAISDAIVAASKRAAELAAEVAKAHG